ncbi:MAG: nicotinate (nicotinamide) nucleotide adenylyltransferase [Paucibacter sp.]|nr:nicotinate (nicotinamide) nucleotide adenylyltransferase [Roseateles sp.]
MVVKTGLFGGTFDPPHLAHRALAQTALDQLGLDRVLWVPAGQPWQKAGVSPAEHRRAMVALMLEGEPRFELDASEIERQGPSYTIDTVREHLGEELFVIVGQDQLARIETWHEWQDLCSLVTLAVAARSGEAVHASAAVHRIERLDMPAMQISSTSIRAAAARGEDLSPLVGTAVAGYIARHRLYSNQ